MVARWWWGLAGSHLVLVAEQGVTRELGWGAGGWRVLKEIDIGGIRSMVVKMIILAQEFTM